MLGDLGVDLGEELLELGGPVPAVDRRDHRAVGDVERREQACDARAGRSHACAARACPAFPDRFGCLADARAFCEAFFAYYNHEHRHCGLGLHTPASVHHGTAGEVRAQRAATLHAAYAANRTRLGRRRPVPPALPTAAWINQPSREALIQSS